MVIKFNLFGPTPKRSLRQRIKEPIKNQLRFKKDPYKKIRKNYQTIIHEINSFEDALKPLNDSELRARNFKLQTQYKENPTLDPLLIESFAITREASLRALGLRHFDVQVIGGLVLNDQKIAEMKTGEGKTLVATLPACLNAITKKGVHIVTVNNYLASRDQESIYNF